MIPVAYAHPVYDYELAFQKWAEDYVARWKLARIGERPFNLATFDGCTFLPDVCLACCLMHDILYWYARCMEDRAEADRLFRDCIIAMGNREDRFKGFWFLLGWSAYLAVTGFGAKYVLERLAIEEYAR